MMFLAKKLSWKRTILLGFFVVLLPWITLFQHNQTFKNHAETYTSMHESAHQTDCNDVGCDDDIQKQSCIEHCLSAVTEMEAVVFVAPLGIQMHIPAFERLVYAKVSIDQPFLQKTGPPKRLAIHLTTQKRE